MQILIIVSVLYLEVCGLEISVIEFLHDPFFKTFMSVTK